MTADLFTLFCIQPEPLLSDIPDAQIRIACAKCGSGWQYDREERIGALGDIKVAQFVWRITNGCYRRGSVEYPCGARVVG